MVLAGNWEISTFVGKFLAENVDFGGKRGGKYDVTVKIDYWRIELTLVFVL